jgi:hypothetical protein
MKTIQKRALQLFIGVLAMCAAAAYRTAAASVVEERLEPAGVRLAMLLNEAAKPAPPEESLSRIPCKLS